MDIVYYLIFKKLMFPHVFAFLLHAGTDAKQSVMSYRNKVDLIERERIK